MAFRSFSWLVMAHVAQADEYKGQMNTHLDEYKYPAGNKMGLGGCGGVV